MLEAVPGYYLCGKLFLLVVGEAVPTKIYLREHFPQVKFEEFFNSILHNNYDEVRPTNST